MEIVEQLMAYAEADADVLRSLNSNGDNFSLFRNVDFLLEAPTADQAETICGFINDFNYGRASLDGVFEASYRVKVVINMPVNQPIISSISGFMACVANLFGGSLNGWGCVAQTQIN